MDDITNNNVDLPTLAARIEGGSTSAVISPEGAPERIPAGEITAGYQNALPEPASIPVHRAEFSNVSGHSGPEITHGTTLTPGTTFKT